MESKESPSLSSGRSGGVSRRALMLSGMTGILAGGLPAVAWAAPGEKSLASNRARVEEGQRAVRALRPGEVSENGWPIETQANAGGSVWTRTVPGTSLSIELSSSVAGSLLLYVIARVHKEVMELPQEGLVGFLGQSILSQVRPRSNHRSGTAVNVSFSTGARTPGSFFAPPDTSLIEEIVSSTRGVVSWGGSPKVRGTQRNESYFDIAIGPENPSVLDVAMELSPWGVIK